MDFTPSEAQLRVKRFFGGSSMKRGAILFHQMGTGKTCSAIGIADSVDARQFPRVVVLSTASLEQNFRKEILKCGNGRTAYEFLHFNGLTLEKARKMRDASPPFFDNTVTVIDEAHNIAKSLARGRDGVNRILFDMISKARNCKVVALTGTPMVNDAFEIAYLVTMVRGFVPRYCLHFPGLVHMDLDAIDNYLRTGHACVTRHGFDLDSESIWMELLPDWYRYKDPSNKGTGVSKRAQQDRDNDKIVRSFGAKSVSVQWQAPFELEPLAWKAKYVDPETLGCRDDMREDFVRRVRGFVSFSRPTGDTGVYPQVLPANIVECKMTEQQVGAYVAARLREIEHDARQKRMRRRDDEDDSESLYRTYSRRCCDFALDKQSRAGLRALRLSVRDPAADLPRVSPKYAALLRQLEGLWAEGHGTALVYTDFRNVLEGLPAIMATLDANDYQQLTIARLHEGTLHPSKRRYVVFDPTEDSTLLHLFNGDLHSVSQLTRDALQRHNLSGQIACVMLVTQSGSEGMSLRNVRQVHIIEPFWQRVRVQQVVGRAVRAYSHVDLAPQYRNVRVFMYVAVLSPHSESALPAKLRRTDREDGRIMTTDQHLLALSMKKARLIDSFTVLLQEAAIENS